MTRFAFFLFLSLVLILVSCTRESAQVEVEEAPPPIERRKGLTASEVKDLAETRLQERLAKDEPFSEPAEFAAMVKEDFGLDLAVFPEQPQTREELQKAFHAFLDGQVEEEYPPSQLEELRKKSIAAYPTYEPGTPIEVKTRRGVVRGQVKAVQFDRIKVDAHVILFADMESPRKEDFDPEMVQKRREHFLSQQFLRPRARYRAELMKEHIEAFYKKAFFVRYKNRFVRVDQLRKGAYQPKLAKRRALYEATRRAKLKAEISAELREEGYLD